MNECHWCFHSTDFDHFVTTVFLSKFLSLCHTCFFRPDFDKFVRSVFPSQILMNLYCNDHLNFNDGTCCNSREAVTMTQIATFAALCFCTECSQHRHKAASMDTRGDLHSSYREFLFALGKLGLIMGYFFLCDRTSLFMKENKYFSHLNFWLPLGYVFALGLFFTEDTSHTRLLHRDMTDEWKGQCWGWGVRLSF
ncbi:CAS1 domain-containing protein 1 [Portunus trituberculatus]|uniref:CAS1 domain-containing protein 1 n=1 Tax=Portunus trituberculatus TaxID=210409 RepID=A0A5B7IJ11_PORTR|nr:CAS1 domain-containing protein 1 [Portunus trituberculatus]